MKEIAVTDIEGIRIGHAEDMDALTGCTVLIAEEGGTAGVDVRGGAPGTRETDLLDPVNFVQQIQAVILAGGSAFGLDAATGVMQYLEEQNVGFDVGIMKIPIVCGAVLFDLGIGDHRVRPDREMGYQACLNAVNTGCAEGDVGAGAGASVGKILGVEQSMKSGLGSCCFQAGVLKIGAVVAVNCLGDVIHPKTGTIMAGVLSKDRRTFLNTEKIMIEQFAGRNISFGGNTTIGMVVTNGKFTKSQAGKLASMAHNGFARTMRPSHTMLDGDTIFALTTGEVEADINVAGMLAARAVENAVLRAVLKAKSLGGLPCCSELGFLQKQIQEIEAAGDGII